MHMFEMYNKFEVRTRNYYLTNETFKILPWRGYWFRLVRRFFFKTELDIAYCGILSLLKVQVKSSKVQVKRNWDLTKVDKPYFYLDLFDTFCQFELWKLKKNFTTCSTKIFPLRVVKPIQSCLNLLDKCLFKDGF
jgi:hypothetical protein